MCNNTSSCSIHDVWYAEYSRNLRPRAGRLREREREREKREQSEEREGERCVFVCVGRSRPSRYYVWVVNGDWVRVGTRMCVYVSVCVFERERERERERETDRDRDVWGVGGEDGGILGYVAMVA